MSKMTAEEIARADAEWDAEPGTPPDGYSFIPEAECSREELAKRSDLWRAGGMTFFRATTVDWPEPGVWLECWKTQPLKQAEFHPPLTATRP